MKIAFAGFRHGHILGLHRQAMEHPEVEIVGACEEDGEAAAKLDGKVKLTHRSLAAMLDEVPCDAVAIGEYFAKRGSTILAAMKRGRHVIIDKPICTRLSELAEITRLSREKKLSVGCQLDMRGNATTRTVRRIIGEGTLGEIHTVTATGQHPLLWGTRPAWYFEPGLHGGTINDIAIHGLDIIPWITGRRFVEVVAAREWNARVPSRPHFKDCGQFMLKLDNGGGVLGDVSYLAPDGTGYIAPQYWRMTFHGAEGFIEIGGGKGPITMALHADKELRTVQADGENERVALDSFVAEVAGRTPVALTTAEVLESSRIALTVQAAAEANECHVAL